MLYPYGPPSSVRILEEISFWKNQEKENTALIKFAFPELEAPYVKLMDDWAAVFAATGNAARSLLETPPSIAAPSGADPTEAERLAAAAGEQSREFIRQLTAIHEQTPALRGAAEEAFLPHVIRETEYFLGVLNRPGYSGAPFGTAGDASARLSEGASAGFSPSGTGDQELGPTPAQRELAPVPIGGHKLPPLPYPYNALEPYIDEKTMRIHHDIHHKSYVDGLNKAEKKLSDARKSGDFELVKHWERELAFNGAGHYLHTIFWDEMSPHGGGSPTGALLMAIERDFGSYNAFKKQFSEAAEKVEGGGWAILVWSPRSHRLEILTAEKHQNLSQWDVVPLLALDVWEHAYYLKHQSRRGDYIKDWWKVVNWPYVSERYAQAIKLAWKPY
ncbi:Fe-Mn family superoxide dismutase [Paenibacillus durus]|uniref:superoxide dismutase n=3 Tax=Paenibacillus durus TaxID=44251 RepID=A0A0F7FEG7_PAEDU|nr:Fe-Mn family superoxide dismutase [Paenibacillus durus]AKG37393.1 superoxide dismutase [Paenibacillus durus ATCC 35681]